MSLKHDRIADLVKLEKQLFNSFLGKIVNYKKTFKT